MATETFYPIDIASPVQVTRELYTNVGSGINIVGDYTRGFLGGTDFEIWDSAAAGTQLTEGVDYDLVNQNTYYSALTTPDDTYEGYQISNATYQTGNIYITYKTIGSFTNSQFYNDISTNKLDKTLTTDKIWQGVAGVAAEVDGVKSLTGAGLVIRYLDVTILNGQTQVMTAHGTFTNIICVIGSEFRSGTTARVYSSHSDSASIYTYSRGATTLNLVTVSGDTVVRVYYLASA